VIRIMLALALLLGGGIVTVSCGGGSDQPNPSGDLGY
jgi:hypothetical protein